MTEPPRPEVGDAGARPSRLDRALRIFTETRAGEGRTALLMLANVLLILCAYYFIKPLREGWLAISGVAGLTEMELKAYSSFGQGIVLLGATALYARFVGRVSPVTLISRTTLFCISNLVVFWLLRPGFLFGNAPLVGIIFYLWVGMFGVFVVAQFWAFAADLYDNEQGERLIPLIAIGATAGGVVGSWIAEQLVERLQILPGHMMLIAVVPLAASIALTRAARRSVPPPSETAREAEAPDGPTTPHGALSLVLRSRYLLVIAVVTLILNWVNTNGENVLFQVVTDVLREDAEAAGLADDEARQLFIRDGTAAFYNSFFFWVNLVALLVQSLLASRLLKYGGFGTIFLLLPVVALLSYSAIYLFQVLLVLKVMKVAENATDYSINNTARHVLWLPIDGAVTYRAKPTIDSLFARLGDGLAALTVVVGTYWIVLPLAGYVALNIALVLTWLVLGVWIVRRHARILRGQGLDAED